MVFLGYGMAYRKSASADCIGSDYGAGYYVEKTKKDEKKAAGKIIWKSREIKRTAEILAGKIISGHFTINQTGAE